jgi:transcription-repair coupling factor (superfamily II helicase)
MLAQAVHQLRESRQFELPEGSLPRIKEIAMPVAVDLPLPVGIDLNYIAKQDLRLKLYRRIADLEDQQSITAMIEEFQDRFGPLPENTENLFYQMRVKIMAEECGLSGISMEDHKIFLRFPPLPEGGKQRDLPVLGMNTRIGKNGYWVMVDEKTDWREHLIQVLYELVRELKIRTL